jgi:hypothetical protein
MSLWTALSSSERMMFHDILLSDGWVQASPVYSFADGSQEPFYLWDGERFTFSGAVEGGEAIPFAALGMLDRGSGFMVAGGVMVAALALFVLLKGK